MLVSVTVPLENAAVTSEFAALTLLKHPLPVPYEMQAELLSVIAAYIFPAHVESAPEDERLMQFAVLLQLSLNV